MRTHVTFQSDFSERAGANEPAGRDLAVHLAQDLQAAGYTVGTPENLENYAFIFPCTNARASHTVTVALVGDGVLQWLALVEPRIGVARRLLSKVGIEGSPPAPTPELAAVCTALHTLLRRDTKFSTIRWYTPDEWDTNPEGQWSTSP